MGLSTRPERPKYVALGLRPGQHLPPGAIALPGAGYDSAGDEQFAFGTPDAHRAALASLVNLPPP